MEQTLTERHFSISLTSSCHIGHSDFIYPNRTHQSPISLHLAKKANIQQKDDEIMETMRQEQVVTQSELQ